ncbi:MAG: tRNA lysidine(34) synthetase TilS [Zavarzinella sp.]
MASGLLTQLEIFFRDFTPTVGRPGIVAVSGGADSVALARLLAEIFTPGCLLIAHLNHQLRGPESLADAEWVNCLLPQITHITETLPSDSFTNTGSDGIEATARKLRYDFLARIAHQHQACWVATGHTKTDQAETVLHRIIRGTGVRGLGAIPTVRLLEGTVPLLRPLLMVARSELEDYLREIGQSWREDSTNAASDYTRNRIRHELIPLLKTFNPSVENQLTQLAMQAQELSEGIEEWCEQLLSKIELPPAGRVRILSRGEFLSHPRWLQKEVLRYLCRREHWPISQFTAVHWDRMCQFIENQVPRTDFPQGLVLVVRPQIVQFGPTKE